MSQKTLPSPVKTQLLQEETLEAFCLLRHVLLYEVDKYYESDSSVGNIAVESNGQYSTFKVENYISAKLRAEERKWLACVGEGCQITKAGKAALAQYNAGSYVEPASPITETHFDKTKKDLLNRGWVVWSALIIFALNNLVGLANGAWDFVEKVLKALFPH